VFHELLAMVRNESDQGFRIDTRLVQRLKHLSEKGIDVMQCIFVAVPYFIHVIRGIIQFQVRKIIHEGTKGRWKILGERVVMMRGVEKKEIEMPAGRQALTDALFQLVHGILIGRTRG